MTEHVDHADNVETANTVSQAEHVGKIENATIQRPPTEDELRTRRLIAVAMIGGAVTIIVTLLVAVFLIRNANNDASTARANLACSTAFGRDITAGNQAAFSSFVDLLVAISDPATDQPTHAANYRIQLPRLQDANASYKAAIIARDEWVASGSPLPCPIPT